MQDSSEGASSSRAQQGTTTARRASTRGCKNAAQQCPPESPVPPLPRRFRLPFSRVRLDAAREILAERGGRVPHASVLAGNRGPHRRIAHVSRRRGKIQIERQSIPQNARVSASRRLCAKFRVLRTLRDLCRTLGRHPQSGANFDSRFSSREEREGRRFDGFSSLHMRKILR